ncbi:MAG: YggS family pyridoxal phosphate-dependent enzyme [Phycisphaeraceae bacterium]|nr:YggS family pyridoxal phosphate-dependent enzyme [Phycisphaerales bacterium]MCB9858995.1 YggS family pyridoxal phosphate-dependent enzyme [Phycisphaeraceae bacterium]
MGTTTAKRTSADIDDTAKDGTPEITGEALKQRYEQVLENVANAAKRSGRRAQDIITVAVTKYASPDQIKAVYNLGHSDFGENRAQQLIQRAAMMEEHVKRRDILVQTRRELSSLFKDDPEQEHAGHPVRWHMIGHLQRNKVKKTLEVVRLLHSADSLRLAEEVQQYAMKHDTTVEVLLQVNSTGEESKEGCPLPAAKYLAEQIDTMVYVRVRGLMTMGPTPVEGESHQEFLSKTRECFERTRDLFEDIGKLDISEGQFNLLSMGMSNDYEIGIECGANLIRVGSAIFGDHQEADATNDDADSGED